MNGPPAQRVPPLHLMAIFAYVVDANGFSAAARRLGMSKSAVSKAVSELEEHLGVRLLQRTTRSLRLTDAGIHFHARASLILREAEQAELEVGRLDGRPRGKVRVNAPLALGRRFVLPVVIDLLRQHPELEIELNLQDDYVDLVQSGTDVAVRVGRVLGNSLVAKKIAPVRAFLVATPSYLAAHGTPEAPEDLTRHPFILYTLTSRPGELLLEKDGERVTVKIEGALRTNNGDAVLDAALAGAGIAFSPEFIGASEICRGDLVRILPDWSLPPSAIHVVYAEAGPVTAAVRLLIDALVERVHELRRLSGDLPFGLALQGLVAGDLPPRQPGETRLDDHAEG
ncbi:MAG: LysR family transcriptional regulator [Deltaproteobacteria bacterium]|nr:LysR family transcriptional regulator [Deltaproteobacteria bacterium]